MLDYVMCKPLAQLTRKTKNVFSEYVGMKRRLRHSEEEMLPFCCLLVVGVWKDNFTHIPVALSKLTAFFLISGSLLLIIMTLFLIQ
jgi:hypothetical protein